MLGLWLSAFREPSKKHAEVDFDIKKVDSRISRTALVTPTTLNYDDVFDPTMQFNLWRQVRVNSLQWHRLGAN